MKCTDESDDTISLPSSNNTAAVDDMSKGIIKKFSLEDNTDNTPPCGISSSREGEEMNSEKKCRSRSILPANT